ncbi:MAG TPA: type III glutamate--ammonia ligase [Gemmataceae bacterium]|nr:type III glutamate--ammonia ligase [Gemmataceae bacterium]
MSRNTLKTQLQKDGIEYLLVQFVDIHGAPKVKMVPVDALDDATDTGAGFAGGAVWGLGQDASSHDMMARIDPASYTPLPWKPGLARFAADLYVDGRPHPHCARVNLKRVLGEVRAAGYVFNVGVEPEHFLVGRTPDGRIEPWDPAGVDNLAKPCYDFKGLAGAFDYLRDMNDALRKLGWGVYQSDHEDANAQYEINFKYADALTTADRFIFFKMLAGETARKHGAVATFMAKPFTDRTGSGAHMHYHLAEAETGRNLFTADQDRRGLGLSELGYHFLGGVLAHARALCAVTSPTVNCYKRLQVGQGLYSARSGYTWTPAYITYGDNNRTQMIRTPDAGHVEDRTVSAAFNPYLAFAAYLYAGLDGIKSRLDPGEPNLGNMYAMSLEEMTRRKIRVLPQSLSEALDALERDQVIQPALGPIYPEFLKLKRAEWNDYHRQVSPWEVERYLTML